MAIQTGIGDYLALDDSGGNARDITDDVTNYDVAIAQNTLDITTIGKSAIAKLIALNDLTVTISGAFDAAANKQHAVMGTRSGTRTFDLRIGGNTSSNPRLQAEMLITDYSFSRGTDGSLTYSCGLALQSGTTPTFDTVP